MIYAIGKGKEEKFFTLWLHTSVPNRSGGSEPKSYFIQILSTDHNKALEKARAISKRDSIPLNKSYYEELNPLDYKSQERLDELARLRKKEEDRRLQWHLNNMSNWGVTLWGYAMANFVNSFDSRDKPELDTEKRTTVKGKIINIDWYPNNYSPNPKDGSWKCIIELQDGKKVFGSLPKCKDYNLSKEYNKTIKVDPLPGQTIEFNAKFEKPDNFNNTFYFYKRPTKGRLV